DRAIALAPDYDAPYCRKSYYLAASRRADEAVNVASAGLAVNPNNQSCYVARASAEISLGRFERGKIRLATGDSVQPG
ncbi:MAG TPA: hypothetical protein VEK35_01340, partial [Roseiarcus sp.]|nr:hypothetical protein [Roseiarcus sp.]